MIEEIGKYVSLQQGLAINKKSNYLVYRKSHPVDAIPLLRIQDMISNSEGDVYIDKKVSPQFLASPSDLIYTRTGQPGLVFKGKSGVVHNNCFKIKIVSDELDKEYLYQILSSDFVRKQIFSKGNSSIQLDITHQIFKSIKIPIFNLSQQRKIGRKLGLIDSKIGNNNAIINALINKIKDIYSYWFVGNYAKVMFNEGLEFAKKSIVDNELCSLISSGIQKFSGLKDYFSTSEVNGSTYKSANNLITYEKRESRANMQPLPFSVWFAKMKNSIKHISFSKQSYLEKRIILSTGFAGLKCSELTYPYIWSIINTQSWFKKKKDYIATGSTQEALNETTLSYIKIEIPNNDCLAEYYKQTQQLILLIEKLMELNKHLLDYKTELLYKLIK